MKFNSILLFFVLIFFSFFKVEGQILIEREPSFPIEFIPNPPSTNPPAVNYCDTCEKEVYLIHGLAGNINSWKNVNGAIRYGYGSDFPARKVKRSIKIAYDDTPDDLESMAVKVYHEIGNLQSGHGTTGPDNTILIAHSQGGLVIREINYQNATQPSYDDLALRRSGPSITFGTPHQGARILNSIDPNGQNMADEFLNEACRKLGTAEVNNILKEFFFAPFISSAIVDTFTIKVCSSLVSTGINFMFKDMLIPATAQYKVGAQKISDLNSFNHTVPFLLFYGEEEAPVFWRTMGSYVYEYPKATLVDPFGMDDDSDGVDNFVKLRNRYLSLAIRSRLQSLEYERQEAYFHRRAVTIGALHPSLHFFYMGQMEMAYLNKLKEQEYQKSYTEAKNFVESANSRWERIIGARYGSNTILSGFYCLCMEKSSPFIPSSITLVNDPLHCTSTPGEENCTAVPRILLSFSSKPNDGVVLSESAGTLNGAVNSVKMERTNHQQMRNCTETKIGLNAAFDGAYGTAFYIEKK